MTSEAWSWRKNCCVTYGTNVLANFGESEKEMHNCPESLEEADNMMLVQIKDMIGNGMKTFLLRTVDSDVIVILLGFMPQFIELHEEVKIWDRRP